MTDEQIIESLGATSAPEAAQHLMVSNVRKVVGLRTADAVESILTDEQRGFYEDLQNQGDDQALWDWLRTEVVGTDVSEVYEATLKSYLEEMADQLV